MSVDMTKWCELARKNIHARPAGVGRVAGKICIVTGAAQGFGKGTAEELYIDALLCYAYLGDVTASVTGDKKAQKFEDEYLDDVIACIKDCGIRAVTYMPTRNTPEQLTRLRRLCDENGLFQVSGEDINSPRQSFIIRAMENPLFANLIDATWKLIEHEKTGSAIC